ncbi:MAG: 4Fe-4S dicluster domain-containing protein [Candidatus Bathyarchaeia archaeon]|jgi:4Fe-4S ferredoxin
MPLKALKEETAESLTLEWVLHVKNYKLTLDKRKCVGCQICTLACPKEAVKLERRPKIQGEKAQKAKVDIDLAKCNFCGICDVSCPYGAINVTVDGKHLLAVLDKQSFPQLVRDIKVDANKFPLDDEKSEDVCPLKLIKVSFLTADGKKVEEPSSLSEPERQRLSVNVEIEKEHCPCCGICEVKLPDGAIHVRKFISGKLSVNAEKCPDGCTVCMDVCPITGALYVSDSDKKVHVNEMFCVYCGACKLACPADDALELKRTHINHTPVRSGAWNKALERLTSSTEMSKELKSKGSLKARESVKKRVGLKGEECA